MALNSIADRLTPSVPIELTYSAQPIAAGKKMTTLFAHKAGSLGSAPDYDVYPVTNVGDPDAVKAEVELVAGEGSQAAQMAYAFVAANAKVGRSNFPAFQIVLLPEGEQNFGPSDEGLAIVKTMRSDVMVSCYPITNTNRSKLMDLAAEMSGADRDLNGQFGTTVVFATLQVAAQALARTLNSRNAIVYWLQDTNNVPFTFTGGYSQGSNQITNASSYTGLAAGTVVENADLPNGQATITSIDPAGAVVNLDQQFTTQPDPTAPASQFTVNVAPSNAVEIVAAACAGAMMSFGQPYVPLQGVAIGGLVPPVKRSDWIIINPVGLTEQALNLGVSPLTVQPGGVVGFVRTRVSLTLKPDGVTAVTDYIDWQQIQKLYDFKEALYQVSQNPPFNNNPGGAMASQEIAAKFGDEMLRVANDFQTAGMFQNVKLLSKYFACQPSTTSRGRMDFRVPVDAIPGLYVIAGNIVAVSDAVNFTI